MKDRTNDGCFDVKVLCVKILLHIIVESTDIGTVVVRGACKNGLNSEDITMNALTLLLLSKFFNNVDKVIIAVVLLVVLSVLKEHETREKSISSHFSHHYMFISQGLNEFVFELFDMMVEMSR